jgi:hypothetical protein
VRPQLQLPWRDGKTRSPRQLHQLRQVLRRTALGLKSRIVSHRSQKQSQGITFHAMRITALLA